MAATGLFSATVGRITANFSQGHHVQQIRTKFVDARMLRDYKRRLTAKEYAPLRLRLLSMKRNDILPPEIQEIASREMLEVPRQAAMSHLTPRCVLSSRSRGNVLRWRLSRFIFRRLADYNRLSGIQRALWG